MTVISAAAASTDRAVGRWRFVPSAPEAIALVLTIALPLGLGHYWLSPDGDPARHIRVGETILQSGLFRQDPFSFTKPGAPFVAYEWLSEVLFALAVRFAGLAGLVALTGAVLGLTYGVVARSLLRHGVGSLFAAVTLLAVLTLGVPQWRAEPHIFTLLGAAVLLLLIDRASDRRESVTARSLWSDVWPAIALFAAWANLHDGFLFGLIVLAAVVIGDRLDMLAAPTDDRATRRNVLVRHAVMLAAASLAALLTPSGFGLYTHTVGYLRDAYLLDTTREHQSPDFHYQRLALVAVVLVVTALALAPRRVRFSTITLAASSLVFALLARRNLPLLGIIALPLIAAEAARAVATWGSGMGPWWRPLGSRWARLNLVWPLIAVAAMLGMAAEANPPTPLPTAFDPAAFPVQAVRAARAAHIAGRLLNELAWGGYVLYAWPEQRVFVDGQTDFFGDSIVKEYHVIRDVSPGWRNALSGWRIDLALLETDSPLADALAHESGWEPIECDSTAVLFRRNPARPATLGAMASLSGDCGVLALPYGRVLNARSELPNGRWRHLAATYSRRDR